MVFLVIIGAVLVVVCYCALVVASADDDDLERDFHYDKKDGGEA